MTIGSRKSKYVYVDDLDQNWIVVIADDDVISNSGLNPFDPAAPPAGGVKGRLNPKKCRRVYATAEVIPETGSIYYIRRAFIAGTRTAGLYATNTPQSITYTGATNMVTTGRRGEKITF